MLNNVNKQNDLVHEFLRQASLHTIEVDGHSIQLYVPDEHQMQEAYKRNKISFPYWSKVWPSALALSKFLLQHPSYVKEKNVVELGAGLGLPSIVAARYAKEILCTDHSPEAVAFAGLSASHNQAHNFRTAVLDWNEMDVQFDADTILLSDVNYDPAAFENLLLQLRRFLNQGKTILLSTPQRLMAKEFLAALLPYCRDSETIPIMEKGTTTDISVFVLKNEE